MDSSALNDRIDKTREEFPTFTFASGFGSWSLYGFANKPPFDDVRVRRALDLLVDREAFNAVRYPGIGTPIAGPMQPQSIGGVYGLTDDEIKSLINVGPAGPEHIAQAKALFAEAGLDFDNFEFELMSLGLPQFDGDALVLKDAWERAGLTVNFNNSGGVGQFTIRRRANDYEVLYIPSSGFGDDPDFTLGRWYTEKGGLNYPKWVNPEFTRLFNEQQRTADFKKRKQITDELQRLILTEANWWPKLNWRGGWTAWSPRLRNYNASAPGAYAFRGRHEITWIASES